MRKLLTAWNGGPWFGELLKPAFVLLVGLALGFAFWTTTAPVAKAREMTPAEMIQSKLPPAKTLVTASKPEVLFAVCGAIREWTNEFRGDGAAAPCHRSKFIDISIRNQYKQTSSRRNSGR